MLTPLTECLCCGSPLVSVMDFGETVLANNYAVKEKFPLAVNRCTQCHHLQLSHSVAPDILFSDYPYYSGQSHSFVEFTRKFAGVVAQGCAYSLQKLRVLDIACNDGTQLDAFKELGFDTFGVEPCQRVASVAGAKGHTVDCSMLEKSGLTGVFDVLVAQNVLAHTPTPLEFLKKCATLMDDKSRLFLMTSQANMIPDAEFDTVYHEHLSYFCARSLRVLLNRAGLMLRDMVLADIHGGSYVATVVRGDAGTWVSYQELHELRDGRYSAETYRVWRQRVADKILRTRKLVEDFRERGYVIVGCGAPAKGISFLNISGIQVDRLFDTTPFKWGKVAAGREIEPFSKIGELTGGKVLFIILPWNFEREVRENVLALRTNSLDIFIVIK